MYWVVKRVERKDAWKVVPKAEKKVVYWEDQLVVHSAVRSVAWMDALMAVRSVER